jgi:hypothetical protein
MGFRMWLEVESGRISVTVIPASPMADNRGKSAPVVD